jgi:aminopeptidase N
MNKIFILLCIFFAYGFNNDFSVSEIEKSGYRYLFNSGTEIPIDTTIDITYYKLQLRLQLSPNYVYGITTVNGKFKTAGNSLFLNLTNTMLVDSVIGNNVSSFSQANNLLTVNFSSLQFDFGLNIYYKGLPPASGNGSFVFASHSSQPAIWSLSEPYGSSDWFPNKNAPTDKADSSDVWITCPSSLTGVSNGLLKETLINPDNTKTYKWKSSYPIAGYLISIAVSNYTLYYNYFKYSQTDSMALTHYIYPENFSNIKANLDETPNMLAVYSDKFTLYPFINEKYGHAEFGWGGGMEHQTISSMGAFSSGVIAHELAHQWYGDKVTCRDFHHIWLNEGFATYCEAVYVEAVQGKDAYDVFMKTKMNYAKNAVGSIYVNDVTSINEIFDANRSYYKGSVILHMLRGITGDSLFFTIMKSYVNDSLLAYKTAVTADFQRVSERIYGSNLNYFFYEWIYGENFPKYKINWDKVKREGNLYDVSMTLTQTTNTNPVFFTMPVDVKIATKSGDTTFNVLNNSQVQNFAFIVHDEPVALTLDPANKILKEKVGDEPTEVITFRLEQNYPNPFNPSTKITYHIKEYGSVVLKIYDVSGREIQSLVNQKQKPGTYDVKFTPVNIASGVYYYVLKAGDLKDSKKMVYIR